MAAPLKVFFFSLYLLEMLVGILGDGFIVGLLGSKLVRRRKLPPCDMIVASLGASRFLLLWISMLIGISFMVFPKSYSSSILFSFFRSIWILLTSVSFWFAAKLSLFYCVKIATFTHPLFFWLKQKILCLVPRLLMGSMLASCVSALPLIIHCDTNATWRNGSGNDTEAKEQIFSLYYVLPMMFIMLGVPFLLLFTSSVLLTISLRRHLRAIQHHGPGLQDCSTKAHTRTLAVLASFLFLYVWHFVSLICIGTVIAERNMSWVLLTQMVTFLGLMCHPFLLIWSNPKMRGVLERGLQRVLTFLTIRGAA
nr:taste receptor type 2 member 814 [Tachyglossus aculeatus]